MKFQRKQSVGIDAIQWDGTSKGLDVICKEFDCDGKIVLNLSSCNCDPGIFVQTEHGTVHAVAGDYIAKDVLGTIYPISQQKFDKLYEISALNVNAQSDKSSGVPFNLREFQSEVSVWSDKNFPNNHPWMPLLGISEEVGELNHAMLKTWQGIRGTSDEHRVSAKDAVGDIVVYLADFCNRNAFNLEDCITTAWNLVRDRDWNANKLDGNVSQKR